MTHCQVTELPACLPCPALVCACVRVCVLVVGCGVASEEEGSVLACSCAVAWVPVRQAGR